MFPGVWGLSGDMSVFVENPWMPTPSQVIMITRLILKTYENDMVKAFGHRQKEIAEEKEVCQDACKFRWFQTYFF